MNNKQDNLYIPQTDKEISIITNIKESIDFYKNNIYQKTRGQYFFHKKLSKEEISYVYERTKFLDNSVSLKIRLLLIYNDLKNFPTCKICNSPIKLKRLSDIAVFSQIPSFCSISCSEKDNEVITKKIEAICRKTNERAENKTNPYQLESVKETIVLRLRQKYNDNRIINVGQITCRKRGYENYLNNFYVVPCFSYDEYNNMCFETDRYHNKNLTWKCKKCGLEFQSSVRTKAIKPDGIHSTNICCPNCIFPKGSSLPEKQLVSYLKEIFNGKIEENNRKVLKPNEENGWKHCHEIDIWLPEIKYAIEFNGTYHHGDPRFYSENHLIKNSYLAKDVWKADELKRKTAEKEQIEFSVVWEYDWCYRKEIVKEQLKKNIETFKVKYNYNHFS